MAQKLVWGGIVALLLGLGTFLFTVSDVASEDARFDAHLEAGGEEKAFKWKKRTPLPDVLTFGGLGVGLVLVYLGLRRKQDYNPHFVIGSGPKAEAPVAAEILDRRSTSW